MPPSNPTSNTPAYAPTDDDKARMKAEHRIGWHPKGGWCRKFPGEANRTYFGHVPPGEAVRAMLEAERRRQDGTAQAARIANLNLGDAVNLFLAHLDREHRDKNLGDQQRASHGRELTILCDALKRSTKLARFTQADAPDAIFRPLKEAAMLRGLAACEKHVKRVREFLTWCSDTRRFMTAPFYGGAFDPPTEKQKKAAKRGTRKAKGVAFWEPAEVRELVNAAALVGPHFHAQVLLAINGGMGATDLAHLTDDDVDWDRRCIHTERSKTLVPRVVPLWEETITAMRRSREQRPRPAEPQYADRFFLSPGGYPLVTQELNPGTPGDRHDRARTKVHRTDTVKNTFARLINGPAHAPKTGRRWKETMPALRHLKRHRGGFYTLRSVFTTLTMGHGQDRNLEAIILGQQFDRPILEFYIRDDQRAKLRAVVEHVRRQIWSDSAA